MLRYLTTWVLAGIALSALTARGDDIVGWRGNWTGLWPDAQTPVEWSRLPIGATRGLQCATTRPADESAAPQGTTSVRDGLIRDWLVIGPFPVADSAKQFDESQITNETELKPAAGEKVGDLEWKPLSMPPEDRWQFGTTELAWLDPGKALDAKPNQVAYVHTYLYAQTADTVRAVVEHGFGLKVWVNGKPAFSSNDRQYALSSYQQMGRLTISDEYPHAPTFELQLNKGWNRLLCKLTTANKAGWNEMRMCMYLMEKPDAPYEETNILWKAPLANRSTSTPIIVGDCIFVMADPDQLICLDKNTGKQLWTAYNTYYDATPQAERDANPAFKEKAEPLYQQLLAETDYDKRLEIRRKLTQALKDIDDTTYNPKVEGHMSSHFGVVGYSLPTPCSDGRNVYVFCGTGVVACYDLAGQRQWITRLSVPVLVYPCSPALIGNTFAVFMGHLRGLDKNTGKLIWEQKAVTQSNASLIPAKLAGGEVIVSQKGDVVRASDGALLYNNPDKITGDSGWNAPVVLGNLLYLPWYGASVLNILDFSQCTGEKWTPVRKRIEGITINKQPDGKWIDRWAASSWLIHNDLAYVVDIYKTLYIVDLKSKQTLVRQDLDLGGLMHYNAVPVAASPTLLGKYICLLNNQGEAIMIEPGRTFKPVAKNVIGTQLPRVWAAPPQETLSYAPPITDGQHIYLRGEQYLYCIGAK